MNVKKLLIATVSGFVVMFLLAWVGHEMILSGIFESNPMEPIERESPMVLGIAVAYIVIGLIMSYIYPRGIEGDSVFGNGIRFGMIMGLFFSLPIALIFFSTLQDVGFGLVIGESVWHVIEEGAGGVAIAYVYGIDSSESVAEEEPAGQEEYGHHTGGDF